MSYGDERRITAAEIRKRKRINRIKTAIIIFIMVLFLIPTFLCILLGVQLYKLQKKVDNILTYQTRKTGIDDQDTDTWMYAYASETLNNGYTNNDAPDLGRFDNGNTDKGNTDENNLNSNKDTDNNGLKDSGKGNTVRDKSKTGNVDIDSASKYNTKENLKDNKDNNDNNGNKDNNANNINNDNNEPADVSEAKKDKKSGDTEDSDNGSEKNKDDYKPDVHNDDANNKQSDNEITSLSEKTAELKKDNNKEEAVKEEASAKNKEEGQGIYEGKKVYLTFDDGPSDNTDRILDILAEYDVKATFFVIGGKKNETLNRYKRIVDEGHTLGMHSYSHNYKEIYKSVEDFEKDFTKLWKLLYDTTGYKPTIYRFPGGSKNSVSKHDMKDFIRFLNKKGITYYDWNVVNGDAEGKDYTEQQMIDNVLSGVAKKKTSIVLMHDGQNKDKTVSILPKILDALISGGAKVLPLDENAPLSQQIKASSVK